MPALATAAELLAEFTAHWRAAPGGAVPDGVADKLLALCTTNEVATLEPRAMARLLGQHAPADVHAYFANVRRSELALACAAGNGNAVAVLEIQRANGQAIDVVCRRFVNASQGVDDLRQVLFTKLFVAAPGVQPKILQYAGLGFLENWLRVTAVRLFIDLQKRKDRPRENAASDEAIIALAHPEDLALELIKSEYRSAVTSALRHAVNNLAAGDRHILRQHLVAKLTIDQLGSVLGIHRATAARRITQAREKLAQETRERLQATLAVDAAECAEIMNVVMSRLDVSLSSLLATRGVA